MVAARPRAHTRLDPRPLLLFSLATGELRAHWLDLGLPGALVLPAGSSLLDPRLAFHHLSGHVEKHLGVLFVSWPCAAAVVD